MDMYVFFLFVDDVFVLLENDVCVWMYMMGKCCVFVMIVMIVVVVIVFGVFRV